ncbi:uncharacterized protein [Nicotiana tomentosiformis]|uniref:uncharacterized protein n=1 Tax=Nicotiana tomentosiformis TaxID=4098 RepID=UPI00388C6D60
MAIVDQTDATGTTTNVEIVVNSMLDPNDPLYLHPSDNPRAMLVSVAFSGIGYRSWRCADLRGLSVKNKTCFISGEYITGYYTQLKKLWEELSILSAKTQCSCQCTYGAKESMHKAEQDRRLIQFLMGLNEIYTTVRGSILMMNPLPSMAQAFFLLIQDEKQREMKPPNQMVAESVFLHANASENANNFRNNNFRANYTPNANFPNTNRSRPFCDYRKRPRHTKDKCFKLHGYSQTPRNYQNLKYNKNKRVGANAHSNLHDELSAKTEEFGPKDESQNLNLSKEQYGQLLNILQHFNTSSGGESSQNTNHRAGSVNLVAGTMNFAGMITCTSSIDFDKLSCRCFRTWIDTWILDSGASNHMTFNKTSLVDIRILPYPLLVTLPNGYRVKVTDIGSVYLAPQITLHKVMFVPSFKFDLISISSLTAQLKSLIAFTDTCCVLPFNEEASGDW